MFLQSLSVPTGVSFFYLFICLFIYYYFSTHAGVSTSTESESASSTFGIRKSAKTWKKGRREKSQSNKSKQKQNSDDDEMIAARILFCDYLICTKSTSELFLCIKIITIARTFWVILDVINACCHFWSFLRLWIKSYDVVI